MSGVRQKHPDALVDRRRSRVKALVPVGEPGEGSIPPADRELPEGLHSKAQRIWKETVTFAHHHLCSPDGLALDAGFTGSASGGRRPSESHSRASWFAVSVSLASIHASAI